MMISDAASTSAESSVPVKTLERAMQEGDADAAPRYAASCSDGTVNSFVTGISVVFRVHPAQRAEW